MLVIIGMKKALAYEKKEKRQIDKIAKEVKHLQTMQKGEVRRMRKHHHHKY